MRELQKMTWGESEETGVVLSGQGKVQGMLKFHFLKKAGAEEMNSHKNVWESELCHLTWSCVT